MFSKESCGKKEKSRRKGTTSSPYFGEKSFEAPCSSGSSENIQDTDQEMQIVEELHAARLGKTLDLPVVPPSGELMSMEIDLVEDDAHSSAGIPLANTTDKKLLIVIDTNILMNHLKFVRLLKTTEIPGFDKLVLLIPWVVIQELDRMKAGKLLKHAQHKAIPAVRFISDSLKNKDGKLWGQSIQLASQKLYGLSDENNDDRVLKCCLQHQELFPCSVVILCTYSMLYLKPPWTLIHLLQCFKKHWLAVFGLVMEKNLLLTIESLYENLRNANNTVDFITVKFLLQDSKSLLHAFSTRSNYDGILPQAFAQVNKLLQTFAEHFCTSRWYFMLFRVWIEESMDVFQRLGSNSALTTSKIASFEEAFVYLQKLMAAVKDILEGIQREKLTIGCCQLVEMEHTMQQCNASVYVEARNRGWCEDVLNYRT
ncbi:PREDICTED: transcriptional protein SWT1 [Propithecus coquereli]|uniref:transcriptional protein SWT1 n=1 Tax=Propithecus coquereli TaxID=379532 RepID=UPI00063F2351|nr:PREDICTED: transcriptional protein SWT1 [Propithecus coquereli]